MTSINCALSVNSTTAIACGISGSIFKTSDKGKTWNSIADGQTEHFHDIAILNESTFFVAGSNGAIYKTLNGGTTWSAQTSGTTAWIYGIDFYDENRGLAVCHDGTILKTTNGGEAWTNIGIVKNNGLNDVKFYNADTAFICSSSGNVYFSGDAGENWTLKNTDRRASLKKILYVEDTIYISGDKGTILKSTDFGENWLLEETFTFYEINDIKLTKKGDIFTCGGNTTIFRYSNDVSTSIFEPFVNNKSLSVFPNPFRNFISIKGFEPNQQAVRVQLFELSGRMVLDKSIEYRDGAIQVNTTTLNQGIYLIRVFNGNNIYTQKVIKPGE
jgi:photosystem II stability/assembly factor-like uncharacterized protein